MTDACLSNWHATLRLPLVARPISRGERNRDKGVRDKTQSTVNPGSSSNSLDITMVTQYSYHVLVLKAHFPYLYPTPEWVNKGFTFSFLTTYFRLSLNCQRHITYKFNNCYCHLKNDEMFHNSSPTNSFHSLTYTRDVLSSTYVFKQYDEK